VFNLSQATARRVVPALAIVADHLQRPIQKGRRNRRPFEALEKCGGLFGCDLPRRIERAGIVVPGQGG
jgi:hypothetical protein